MGCGSCHRLAAGAGVGHIGPDLDTVLPNLDAEMLRAKITDPYPTGAGGTFAQMPDPSGRMSRTELDALVAFLLATARD
jgi:mono/diheme cytochrome c family protein